MNIIFYSQNCGPSKNLISSMKNIGILDKFKCFCVDDNLDAVPPHITDVPTLIVSGISHPLVKKDAFKWVESIKYIKQSQAINQQKKLILANMMQQAQMKGPHGYSQGEMSGVSDTFAYTDIDMAQPHSYLNYGEENANAIFTAPEEAKKITKAEQNQKISNYMASLDKQNNDIQLSMKKEQLNKILIEEQQKLNEINN